MDELSLIKEEFKKSLSFESKSDKFEGLRQVALLTDSSQLPDFMKNRILKRIDENQKAIVGLLDERLIGAI